MSEALERVKKRREAALAAQAEASSKEAELVRCNHQRAKDHSLVEKTAGKSGAAGKLKMKWEKWLSSEHGKDTATRLADGSSPTIEEAKLFSTWVFTTRQRFSAVGRQGGV